MGTIRAWLLLVTFIAGVAAAFAVLAPRGVTEDLDKEVDARLERTHHAASLLLRVNARKWIDTSAQVASDAVLIESLDQATRGPTDLALVHKTVQDRLKYFNERMKVDLVAATDAHGRVIARVGVDASAYKDSIEGYPLVADALRGQRGDDTWPIAGRLYRVAASPVILRDHYVGVVLLGQEATAELAESMKATLGAEVAFLLRGRVIAATGGLPIADKLPIAASTRTEELGRAGRTGAMTVDGWAVVLGNVPGEAAEQQALFALCTPRHASVTLASLVDGLSHTDARTLPWHALWPIGAATALALLIGAVLVSRLGMRPLDLLLTQVRAVSRGELQRLPEERHRGRMAILAHAFNTTIERLSTRARALPGSASAPAPSHAPVPVEPRPETPPAANTTPAPAAAATNGRPSNRDGTGEFDDRLTRARDPWPAKPPAPRPLFTQTMTPLPPPIAASDSGEHDGAVRPNDLLPSLGSLDASVSAPTRTSTAHKPFEETTSVESPSEALLIASAHGTSEEIEAEYQRIFDEFVATRQKCGEGLEGVSYDKFAEKLRHNRAQLIQRYGCANVRFQVYIKDGRTALKATPVT